jgi:hypothetical protein
MRHWVRTALVAVAFSFGATPAASNAELAEERDLAPFEAIDANGTMTIDVHVGAEQSVRVVQDGGIAAQIEVQDGVLIVRSPSSPRTDGMVRLHISVPRLHTVALDGIWSHLTITDLEASRFRLRLRSSSDATISGTCEIGEFVIIGAPQLNAEALTCQDIDLDISGAGRANVRASRRSTVRILGSGEVDLHGGAELIASRGARRKVTIHQD